MNALFTIRFDLIVLQLLRNLLVENSVFTHPTDIPTDSRVSMGLSIGRKHLTIMGLGRNNRRGVARAAAAAEVFYDARAPSEYTVFFNDSCVARRLVEVYLNLFLHIAR